MTPTRVVSARPVPTTGHGTTRVVVGGVARLVSLAGWLVPAWPYVRWQEGAVHGVNPMAVIMWVFAGSAVVLLAGGVCAKGGVLGRPRPRAVPVVLATGGLTIAGAVLLLELNLVITLSYLGGNPCSRLCPPAPAVGAALFGVAVIGGVVDLAATTSGLLAMRRQLPPAPVRAAATALLSLGALSAAAATVLLCAAFRG